MELETSDRQPFQWILEKSMYAKDLLRSEEEEEEEEGWNRLAKYLAEQLETIPVCAENSTDVVVYLQTLDYWQVDWSDTPVAFLDLLVWTPDNQRMVEKALNKYALELGEDSRHQDIERLALLRDRSSYLQSSGNHFKYDIRTNSYVGSPMFLQYYSEGAIRLFHFLLVFADEPQTCDMSFVDPWLRDETLGKAATELAMRLVDMTGSRDLLHCPPLFHWLVEHALRSSDNKEELASQLLAFVLSDFSLIGMRELQEAFREKADFLKAPLRQVLKVNKIPYINILENHSLSEEMVDVLVDIDPGLLVDKMFINNVLSNFRSPNIIEPNARIMWAKPSISKSGLGGALRLAHRLAEHVVFRFTHGELENIAGVVCNDQFNPYKKNPLLKGREEFKNALLALVANAMIPGGPNAQYEIDNIEANFRSLIL